MVNNSPPLAGCWFPFHKPHAAYHIQRSYLPLASLKMHTAILSTASRTTMTQTFINSTDEDLKEIIYSFPLYHGVSVVSFGATVGGVRMVGVVKEKDQAREDYRRATEKGEAAGLLEQLPEASDMFTSKIGNVRSGETVVVELVCVGELKHDAEVDGIRFTIPATVAPRYGSTPHDILSSHLLSPVVGAKIEFAVDVHADDESPVAQLQSPSHPISVTVGRTTDMAEGDFNPCRASATLALDTTVMEKDFIVIVKCRLAEVPRALLETHPTIPNQRALMTTLTPRFKLPPSLGEVVFIVDRSGSMEDRIDMTKKAMTVLLKSLPVGVKFNICSFGSNHSFLWERSQAYGSSTLNEALRHVGSFDADLGGTEILAPVAATIEARYRDLHLDMIIMTDGQVWHSEDLFACIGKAAEEHSCRAFSLGIGDGVSTSLVEGIAEAGGGYSQFVTKNEHMDKKVVRLLKGALSPRVGDYNLEIKFAQPDGDDADFDIIEPQSEASRSEVTLPDRARRITRSAAKVAISLYDATINPADDDDDRPLAERLKDKYAHLPDVAPPPTIQAPYRIPALYPFTKAVVYVLLGPGSCQRRVESVVLRGTSSHGDLELEIPVQDIGSGTTIHQLAAKKAIGELEQGRSGGWLPGTGNDDGSTSRRADLIEREAVRLGVLFQVGGKWCSWVAVQREENDDNGTSPPNNSAAHGEAVVFGGKIPRAPASGMAPRKQLASKAARRSAPSTGSPAAPVRAGRGLGLGGAMRHRKISIYDSEEAMENSGDEMDVDKTPDAVSVGQASTVEDKMHALVKLQDFEGSWNWNTDLFTLLGLDEKSIGAPRTDRKKRVLATALAIAFLRVHGAEDAEAWELIVEKGMQWLAGEVGAGAEKEVSRAGEML